MSSPKIMYANGTILVSRFVEMDPAVNNAVIQATLGSRTIGISGIQADIPSLSISTTVTQTDPPNAAVQGESVDVYTLGMECLLRAGTGGWSCQARLRSDANGCGIPAGNNTVAHIGALALESANVNEYGLVQVVVYDQVVDAS
jgi:hypothetical protein